MINFSKPIQTAIRIEGITPILPVKDMKATRAFYVDLLGFQEEDWGSDEFTSFKHSGGAFYACRGGHIIPGALIWVGFNGDIFALYEELKAANVSILNPPTNYSWALEMEVNDPDGHVLRFGKESDESKPFED